MNKHWNINETSHNSFFYQILITSKHMRQHLHLHMCIIYEAEVYAIYIYPLSPSTNCILKCPETVSNKTFTQFIFTVEIKTVLKDFRGRGFCYRYESWEKETSHFKTDAFLTFRKVVVTDNQMQTIIFVLTNGYKNREREFIPLC